MRTLRDELMCLKDAGYVGRWLWQGATTNPINASPSRDAPQFSPFSTPSTTTQQPQDARDKAKRRQSRGASLRIHFMVDQVHDFTIHISNSREIVLPSNRLESFLHDRPAGHLLSQSDRLVPRCRPVRAMLGEATSPPLGSSWSMTIPPQTRSWQLPRPCPSPHPRPPQRPSPQQRPLHHRCLLHP